MIASVAVGTVRPTTQDNRPGARYGKSRIGRELPADQDRPFAGALHHCGATGAVPVHPHRIAGPTHSDGSGGGRARLVRPGVVFVPDRQPLRVYTSSTRKFSSASAVLLAENE
jgi:hypothetical protein